MKQIKLKNNSQFILVDDDDYESLCARSWFLTKLGYPMANVGNKVVYLHRVLLEAPKGVQVDHVNMNKLDNRRSNLRLCRSGQNRMNEGLKSHNTSGYKGVTWSKAAKKWQVRIYENYNTHYLGLFDDVIESAQAYNEAALRYHGKFARLNKI